MKILAIDDSKFQMKQIHRTLTGAGYDVVSGLNGEEGLALAKEHKPDLIITDLLMPVLDGFGFVEQFRKDDQETPIIVLTADIQETTAKRLEEMGITALVNKPLSKDPFLNLVKETLN
jgi:CheY-like chemotaxis protein